MSELQEKSTDTEAARGFGGVSGLLEFCKGLACFGFFRGLMAVMGFGGTLQRDLRRDLVLIRGTWVPGHAGTSFFGCSSGS